MKEVHDEIRGKGSFDKAIRGIRLLSKAEIPCSVACTIHADNYEMVADIIRVADEAGADRIWFDRYVPCGNARPLSTEQFIVAMTLLAGERGRHKIEVGYNRALQFSFRLRKRLQMLCFSQSRNGTSGQNSFALSQDADTDWKSEK